MNFNKFHEKWQASIGASNGNDAEQEAQVSSDDQANKAGAPVGSSAASDELKWRGKTVLLVDSNLRSRESRAKVMRTMGVRVDCAASADAARVRLAAEKYNLVLVDLGRETEVAESLVREIKGKNSRQLVGFLVGSPLFVAKSLSGSKSHPRRRVPTLANDASAEAPCEPVKADIDFGRRIRDAESEEPA